MSDVPQAPKLAGGAPISITKQEILSLDCPKCKSALNVTDLAFGTNIECPDCKNVTWRPELKLNWWFRLRNLVIANLFSFVIGFSASFAATAIYENYKVIDENPDSMQDKGKENER